MIKPPRCIERQTTANDHVRRVKLSRDVALPFSIASPHLWAIVISISDGLDVRKCLFRGQHVEPRTLELCLSRWEYDQDVGVIGEAVDNEVEHLGLDVERIKLMRRVGFRICPGRR